MRLIATMIAAAFALTACANDGGGGVAKIIDTDGIIDGAVAYTRHCAACHDDGMLGAPRIDVPEEWQGRSSLWQAVLMEHAKDGYYDMPAKGGQMDLRDDVVNAAAEYMLERTFPDRPRD
jgi:cytochrome c5